MPLSGLRRAFVNGRILLLMTGMCFDVRAAADATPEQFSESCGQGVDDTACWQRAISEAGQNGTLAASSGKLYRISRTISVCNGIDGVVDGHGAILEWVGPVDAPMFLVVNSYHMLFRNFTIRARSPHRLQTAIEFASAKSNPPALECFGSARPASKNSVEHVEVQGEGLNDVMYGVRVTNRYGYDANNDMTRIVDSNFSNITVAAVSIETTQAHQNVLLDVTGYGAPGNRGCFLHAGSGFVSSSGGFQGLWGKAAFCLDGGYGPFSITNPNSEGSARLVSVGEVGDVASYPVSVIVSGGRFAADAMDRDSYVISFNRLGTLIVRGLRVDGGRPRGVYPAISIQPGRTTGSPALVSAVVEGVVFFMNASNSWNTLVAAPWADVWEHGNICLNEQGLATNCKQGRGPDGSDLRSGMREGTK
jgi:hypothetical protein